MSLPNSPQSLDELKKIARISGKDAGAGKCLWADEFALRTISDGLRVTLLVIDDQASRGGGGRGRKRGPRRILKTQWMGDSFQLETIHIVLFFIELDGRALQCGFSS